MNKKQKLEQRATFEKLRDEAEAGTRPWEDVQQWLQIQSLFRSANQGWSMPILLGSIAILLIAATILEIMSWFA